METKQCWLILCDGAPLSVLEDQCHRKFHAYIKAHAMQNELQIKVPRYIALAETYQCAAINGDYRVTYQAVLLPVIR